MNNQAPKSGRLVLAEHAYRRYCLDIEAGVTLQDLLKPEMWRLNTDGQLRPRDVVRVRSESGNFDCELNVVAILPGAGVIMEVKGAKCRPGTPMGDRLIAAEAAARAEAQAERQAEIEAAIGGKA